MQRWFVAAFDDFVDDFITLLVILFLSLDTIDDFLHALRITLIPRNALDLWGQRNFAKIRHLRLMIIRMSVFIRHAFKWIHNFSDKKSREYDQMVLD